MGFHGCARSHQENILIVGILSHPITWLPLPNIGNRFDFDHLRPISDYLCCHLVQPGDPDGDGVLDVGAGDDAFADFDDGENLLGFINDQS